MPFEYSCPTCGDSRVYDEALAGHTQACNTCGQPMRIERPRPAPQVGAKSNSAGVVAALIVAAGFFLVGVIVLAGWLLLPMVTTHTGVTHKVACRNNLKQIALALHNYHETHGSFPPAYLTDVKGKPMHSWRVLILPFMEQNSLYREYDFNEPWDGPNNSLLAGRMPEVFFCPENPDPAAAKAGETNYMVVVGPQTMFPGKTAISMNEVPDGLSNTIMVVETTAVGVNWMSPVDLKVDKMAGQINTGPAEIGSYHGEAGAHVALGDGSVAFLPERTRNRALYSALTRDGGETNQLNADP